MWIVALLAALLALGGSAPRDEIPLGGQAILGLAFAHGALWATAGRAGPSALVRVDPATGRVTTVARDVDDCCQPVPAASGVWLGGGGSHVVYASAQGLGRTVPTGSCSIGPFAIAAGAVWRVDGAEGGVNPSGRGSLCRTDLTSGAQRTLSLPAPAIDVAAAGGRIWVGELDGSLLAFDEHSGRLLQRARLGDYGVIGLAARGAELWASNGAAVYRIDARAGRTLERFDGVPDFFTGTLAAGADGVFVLDGRLRIREVGQRGVRTIRGVVLQALALGAGALWGAVRPAKLVRLPLPLAPVLASSLHGSTSGTCTADDLRASVFLQGATGSAAGGVDVVNVVKHSCTLIGRPPVRFTGANGEPEPVVVRPAPRRPRVVTLRPHARAYAMVFWSNWCGAPKRLTIRVGVRDGVLAAPAAGFLEHPRCDAPRLPSLASVGPWQLTTS